MNYDMILVRYGELSLKSTPVRTYFESILIKNIKRALSLEKIVHTVTKERGRIYIKTEETEKSVSVLQRIFGIVSISPAIQTTSEIQEMSTRSLQMLKNNLSKEKTFALRVTRVGSHTFTSQQVAMQLGKNIVELTNASVDLTNPDVEFFIEIRDKKSYLFFKKISGVGGLPLGTQGRVLVLVDKPSSLLAAWFLMRRGCTLHLATTEPYQTVILSFLAYWYANADISILNNTEEKNAEAICSLASRYDCEALVIRQTLEHEQTLSQVMTFKKHCHIPILTPLIAMDETEIIRQCQMRGIQI